MKPRCVAIARVLILGAILSAMAGCAPDASGPSWPGTTWAVSTPEAEGFDPGAIDSLIADIDSGRYGLIDHFLLIRNGRVVANRRWDHAAEYAEILRGVGDTTDHQYNYDHPAWHPYYRETDLHTLQSVTKSVTSVAFGIAVDEGHIASVEAPAWEWFESLGVDMTEPLRAAATLEDFLTMRSGIDWATRGQTYDDDTHPTVELEASDRWIDYVLGRPVETEPGTEFDYNDGVSVLLGKIVGEATGQRLDSWAEERLFGPIGIDEYYWKITPDGEVDSEGGLYLSVYDLARVGYLMLRGGDWDGHQIVSQEWVEMSTLPIVENVGYGYQWWVPVREGGRARVFAGNGYGGQFVHVVPEHDIVSVFFGWTLHERPELSSWLALQERVLPAVIDGQVIDTQATDTQGSDS